jgi:hypothetical protein
MSSLAKNQTHSEIMKNAFCTSMGFLNKDAQSRELLKEAMADFENDVMSKHTRKMFENLLQSNRTDALKVFLRYRAK